MKLLAGAPAAFVLACAVALAAAARPAPAAAAAAAGCSADTFTIDGSPLLVEVCLPADGPSGDHVTLTERFTAKGQAALERPLVVDILTRSETSRAIDDVPLAKLGIARTLHLTVVYKPGSARLEHALLVPGAIALK